MGKQAELTGAVRCKDGFVTARVLDKKGEVVQRAVTVNSGAVLSADNPLVRAYPERFEQIVDDQIERVEAMTGRPGQARRVSARGTTVLKAAKSKRAASKRDEPKGNVAEPADDANAPAGAVAGDTESAN